MKRILPVVIVVSLLGALFAYGTFTPRGNRDIPNAAAGRQMPVFEMALFERYADTHGERFALADHLGDRPLVVNFWASWCGPCYDEAPELERAWRQYQDRVLFVGVDTQDRGNEEAARAFLERFDLTFPNGKDPDSRIGIEFGLFGVPETFFLNPDGTLFHKHVGPITAPQLQTQLDRMLATAEQ